MGTYKKGFALGLVAVAVATFPGAGASATEMPDCFLVPAGVNNQSIVGKEIPGIKDVELCVETDAGAAGEPQVRNYTGCGDPCFAIVIRDLAVEFEVELTLSYTLGGQPQPVEVVSAAQKVEPLSGTHQCIYSYYEGGYNPCNDGVSAPANLEATGRKAKITLAWDKSFAFGQSSVAQYEILRSPTGEEGTFVPVATTADLTFTDTGLPSRTTFWYTVVALDDRGNRSGMAAPASAPTR